MQWPTAAEARPGERCRRPRAAASPKRGTLLGRPNGADHGDRPRFGLPLRCRALLPLFEPPLALAYWHGLRPFTSGRIEDPRSVRGEGERVLFPRFHGKRDGSREAGDDARFLAKPMPGPIQGAIPRPRLDP